MTKWLTNNMKGTTPEEVASRLLNVPGLEGLQVCDLWVWLLLHVQ